jgi:hypothetical protein
MTTRECRWVTVMTIRKRVARALGVECHDDHDDDACDMWCVQIFDALSAVTRKKAQYKNIIEKYIFIFFHHSHVRC